MAVVTKAHDRPAEAGFALYEHAVQSPEIHAEFLERLYRELRAADARVLREDYSGTFLISCAWVERHRANRAIAVDLDPAPLAYGRRVNRARLTASQRARVRVVRGDVRAVVVPPADVTFAGNCSFWLNHSERSLLAYLRAARRGLAPGGILVLESAAGAVPSRSFTRRFRRDHRPWFTYSWTALGYDRARRRGTYELRVEATTGQRRTFTYDFFHWRAPDVERLLRRAGFASTGTVAGRRPRGAKNWALYIVATV